MPEPVILCHGGVGADPVSDYQPGVEAACDEGWRILQSTGSALEAVLAATVALEEDPLFNAGTGSYMKLDGSIAMDAAVAEFDPRGTGPTVSGLTGPGRGGLRFGGVAAIEEVRNPILVAARVMETPARILVGRGATTFARQQGFPPFDPSTEKAVRKREEMNRKVREGTAQAWAMKWAPWLDLAERRSKASSQAGTGTPAATMAHRNDDRPCETVGAVALDGQGRLAATSSTGGLSVQIPGRVGDSCVWGAGLHVKPWGAATATGVGEAIYERHLCRLALERLATREHIGRVTREVVELFPPGIPVGILMVDASGEHAWADNDEGRLPVAVRCRRSD